MCRRAFQKVVAVPTKQLDALWQRYEAFESAGGNPQLAKRLLEQVRVQNSEIPRRFCLCQIVSDTAGTFHGMEVDVLNSICLQERPKYAAAKAALPQRLAHVSPLLTTALALPPGLTRSGAFYLAVKLLQSASSLACLFVKSGPWPHCASAPPVFHRSS